MAGRGRKFAFHGAFKSKRRAVERERKGEFILKRKVRGKKRFLLVERVR